MHNGVITVPMYQGDDITGCLNTAILYAIINNNPLQEIFCAVKLTDKVRLVDTYHGQRMCVSGRLRCRQRDETKENRGGGGRSAGYIDNAGRVVPRSPVSYWCH